MAPSGKWIEGIGPDSSVDEAARRSLEDRLSTVTYWLPLAAYLPEHDLEHVHRLRVSTRRAVAALRLFWEWLPRKRARRLKKRLKSVRRAAGEARDLDVLAQRLERDYGARRVDPVVKKIREHRAAVQPGLVKIADRCRRRDMLVRKAAKLVDKIGPTDENAGGPVPYRDWAARRLAAVAAEFFFSVLPGETADTAALHQFRIRAKTLRYTIELVAPVFPPALRKECYPVVEELQERLGRIQDHVSAIDRLRHWADDSSAAGEQVLWNDLVAEESSRLEEALREFRSWWTAEQIDFVAESLIPDDSREIASPVPQTMGQT